MFLNLCYHLLLGLCLFLFFFLPPVSSNFYASVHLSFIHLYNTLGPLPLSCLRVWALPPVLGHWLTVLTSFPTHLCPHTSHTTLLQLFLFWGPPLPALTQWCFLCNRVLISIWINVNLVWHADKVPLQVVTFHSHVPLPWSREQGKCPGERETMPPDSKLSNMTLDPHCS